MSESEPSVPKPANTLDLVCVVAGAVIGAGVGKAVAASLAGPAVGGGFNVVQLAGAGVGGGVGSVLGVSLSWVIHRLRR